LPAESETQVAALKKRSAVVSRVLRRALPEFLGLLALMLPVRLGLPVQRGLPELLARLEVQSGRWPWWP
jgi:hypothetical protein